MIDLNDYVKNIIEKMTNSGHSEKEVEDVVKRVDKIRNDIDICMKRNKGWKYIRNNFLPELTNENTYFEQFDNRNIVCVDNKDGTYNVCFSFINPSEPHLDKDYKKYVLFNYYKEKYLYKNIKATSYLTAITIANNQNYEKFPIDKSYKYKMTVDVRADNYDGIDLAPDVIVNADVEDTFPKNIRENYKRAFDCLKSKYDLKEGSYRFYSMGSITMLVVRNENKKFTISFTFLSPKDYNAYINLKDSDKKFIKRYCVIQNFLSNRYKYDVDDSTNSLNTIVTAFNKNKDKFPRRYRNTKFYAQLTTSGFSDVDNEN